MLWLKICDWKCPEISVFLRHNHSWKCPNCPKSLLPLTQLEIVLNGKFPIKNIRFSSPQTWLETVLTSHQRNLFLVATDVTGNVLTSHQKCKDFIAINTARNCLNFPSKISDFHHHKHDWKCSKFLSEIFSFVKVNKDQNCPDFSSK